MTGPPPTRPSLLARIRNPRDGVAWAEFVDIYGPLVYDYGRRRGLRGADAANLTQDVLRASVRSPSVTLSCTAPGPRPADNSAISTVLLTTSMRRSGWTPTTPKLTYVADTFTPHDVTSLGRSPTSTGPSPSAEPTATAPNACGRRPPPEMDRGTD